VKGSGDLPPSDGWSRRREEAKAGRGTLAGRGPAGSLHRPRPGPGVVLALGIAVLMSTRPYEGLAVAVVMIGTLLLRPVGSVRPPLSSVNVRALLPATAVLVCAAVLLSPYNRAVTGHALLAPYSVHHAAYDPTHILPGLPAVDPGPQNHEVLERFESGRLKCRQIRSSPAGILRGVGGAIHEYGYFFLGPVVALPFLLQWLVARDRWTERMRMAKRLSEAGGRHLVCVRYARDHPIHEEWVWNEAGIDAATTVWARPVSSHADRALASYFAARRVWQLDADTRPPRLAPWTPQGP
jgi:hypothetical protein